MKGGFIFMFWTIAYIISIIINLSASIEMFIKEFSWKEEKKEIKKHPTVTILKDILFFAFWICLLSLPGLNFIIFKFYFDEYVK
jgi:hypothetical protein